jgi:3-oxoacyl-[acyl-carrier-protein] synthase-3
MNGAEVFRFAIETCSAGVSRVLLQSKTEIGEVDHFIFHQANRRIIDGIIKKLKIAPERCIINIENHGNASSATCAIALDELFSAGKIKRGDKVIISAFGGGLTYASAYFIQGDSNND